jgi:predicted nucleic acid-binding protein
VTTKSALSVVCDAGPIIHLDELDCLTLLNDFDQVLIPSQVCQEVSHHRPGARGKSGLSIQQIDVIIRSDPPFQSLVRSLSLDLGEQAALSLMQNRSEAMFLTDDAAARMTAVTLGYRVHGTIGILLRAIRRNQKTAYDVIEILRSIARQTTLHIRPKLLEEIIERLENEIKI